MAVVRLRPPLRERTPLRPERLFMQFHGGVYRSDDAGESWIDIGQACPRTSGSRS